MLTGKNVVVGVTGGIAAYKACELVRLFKKANASVRVVMTKNAAEFVQPLTFETLSGNQVYTDQFYKAWEIGHISLQNFADLTVIAPATANVIGKMASGIADDLLTTSVMAMTTPVLIAPAMNSGMWRNPATQKNMETLVARGIHVVGPGSGELACGINDVGRMSEPDEIFKKAKEILLAKRDFEGKTVLVTAGPTREKLDPVRFLSNRSTGKMGYAIAEAARDRGACVELVTGPVSIPAPAGVSVTRIESTNDMFKAVTEIAKRADVVIQAAAPADFTPETVKDQKIKKTGDSMTLTLVSTPDIAKYLGSVKRENQVLVAFAAETENAVENAKGKRERKNADLIVANDVTRPGAGFGVDTNVVTIISDEGMTEYPQMSKKDVADKILDHVERILTCNTRK
ncbi:MAG: bifunctional phosphopantothenoylcysteine decarboxylase/phosphopantothenate--cysteine ligase CoaBC [Clostridiales bacterium]|nr:bifunctional phosphopantothenoylcysteine decarboxylase/phosphopantothenate--cysteine ligase CoaBC [Clostridiales bacterium]